MLTCIDAAPLTVAQGLQLAWGLLLLSLGPAIAIAYNERGRRRAAQRFVVRGVVRGVVPGCRVSQGEPGLPCLHHGWRSSRTVRGCPVLGSTVKKSGYLRNS